MSNGEIDWSKYIIPFDNSIDFVYDNCSRLTIKSFGGLTALAYLNGKYPVVSVHSNNGIYYTVYSLKKQQLAYIVFDESPYTGINYLIADIIEYPFDSVDEEQKLWFLLEKDLPENIMKNSGS